MTALALPRLTEEFQRQLSRYPTGTGAALTVLIEGESVVDEWGGQSAPGVPWMADTMAVTFSASKGVSSASLMVVAAEHSLDVDQPVARYWPAFGAEGKATITVTELLSHASGLPYWGRYTDLVTAESSPAVWLLEDEITLAIAESPVVPGTRGRFAYHALTFGWLLHGLVLAMTGLSLSSVFKSLFAEPFGLDYHLGLPAGEAHRVATLLADPPLAPDPADPHPDVTTAALLPGPSGLDYLHNLELLNSPDFYPVPQGASNGIGTARGLAGVYAALAEIGTLAALPKFVAPLIEVTAPGPRRWQGRGFQVHMPTPWNETDTAFGHTGAGGGVAFYDPCRNLAFALVTNHMNFGTDERVNNLRAAIAADLR